MQDFELESLRSGDAHSQLVKGPPILSDSSSKDCVNLPSSTAVSRFKQKISYLAIRIMMWPIQWLPYTAIHRLGYLLGHLTYYFLPKFRKRTLSNLSLASDLNLSPSQIIPIAKASFVNLMITCLEYPKLIREKEIHKIATCDNPEIAAELMHQKTPVIFFCGHQANWEVLFLEGTKRMPGVAIGRPIANTYLYRWILSMREKYGGRIITPQNAIKEGLRALRKGSFLGIVGDQGRPDSGYSCPFFGRNAWTSPMPAILSYRTGSPIIVASTRRIDGKYRIHYSDPIWPNKEKPMEAEIDRMMRLSLGLLEKSIKLAPEQWLFAHNRWKQQTLGKIKRPFRQESICIILPTERAVFETLHTHLNVFRELYPLEFITLCIPECFKDAPVPEGIEVRTYASLPDLKTTDYRFKLVFNFSGDPSIGKHFKKLAAVTTLDLEWTSEKDFPSFLKELVCNAP